ncbi:unnamed protein product [Amoebophrya sp. A120]|nr:unnamed protein product [Amoebophrya sp. A120]|eukprot:GSA120T00020197001.1
MTSFLEQTLRGLHNLHEELQFGTAAQQQPTCEVDTLSAHLATMSSRRSHHHHSATSSSSFRKTLTSFAGAVIQGDNSTAPTPVTPGITGKPPPAPPMDFLGVNNGAPVLPQTFSTMPLPGQASYVKLEKHNAEVRRLAEESWEFRRNLFVTGMFGYAFGVHIAIGKFIIFARDTGRSSVEFVQKLRKIQQDLAKKKKKKDDSSSSDDGKKGKGKKKGKKGRKRGRRGDPGDFDSDYDSDDIEAMDVSDAGIDEKMARVNVENQLAQFQKKDEEASSSSSDDDGPGGKKGKKKGKKKKGKGKGKK